MGAPFDSTPPFGIVGRVDDEAASIAGAASGRPRDAGAVETRVSGAAPKTSRWRKIRRPLAAFGLVLLAVFGVVLADAWEGLGHRATGERLARMQRSPRWRDGAFVNPEEIVNDTPRMFSSVLHTSDDVSPNVPVDATRPDPAALRRPPESGLRITWLGHSSTLIELDGKRFLTDPMWSERAGPLTWIGPRRFFPVLVPLDEIGPIDAVLVSHDHFDHLDHRTIKAMKDWESTVFVVPLGLGAHLEYWGVPASRIREVDWWDETKLGDVTVASTPARHASGRHVFDRDQTLWSSYAIVGPRHRVFFSGDTGLFTALEEIADKYAPFDVTMFEVGQYHQAWPDWHIGPEQAVVAHQKLRGKVFFPIHWALLALAMHAWTEPMERAIAAAEAGGVAIVTPRPGEMVEPTSARVARWWPQVPFQSAAEHPIVSGNVHFRETSPSP